MASIALKKNRSNFLRVMDYWKPFSDYIDRRKNETLDRIFFVVVKINCILATEYL